jgi:hypothetical protein
MEGLVSQCRGPALSCVLSADMLTPASASLRDIDFWRSKQPVNQAGLFLWPHGGRQAQKRTGIGTVSLEHSLVSLTGVI